MTRKRRAPTKSGDEYDVVAYRHLYCWTKKPGACARVKTALNRRLRQTKRDDIKEQTNG